MNFEISVEIFFRLAVIFFARSAALRATSLALSHGAVTPTRTRPHVFKFVETFFQIPNIRILYVLNMNFMQLLAHAAATLEN